MKPRFFKTPADFRAWLEKHHADTPELWVGFYKKASGKVGITYQEGVDAALCYGWIDGIKKRVDEASYMHRFTPRRAGSIWSLVNTRRATALIKEGLMAAPGLQTFQQRDEKTGGTIRTRIERSRSRRHREAVQGEQEGVGVLPRAAAGLSEAGDVLDHGREEGRDAAQAAPDHDRRFSEGNENAMDVTKPALRIVPATERDVPVILRMIKGLAEYERLADHVTATEERLRATLFGARPAAEVVIGYAGDEPAGFALFFQNYSTFLAQPGIYLEDLFVLPEARPRLRAAAPGLSRQARGGARLRPRRVVGARLERAGDRFLQEARRGADGGLDGVPSHRPRAAGACRGIVRL